MGNNIKLEFSKTIDRLAGNEYGANIFENQVKSNVNYNEVNVIVFPEYITDIAISFVQGFTSEIFKNISLLKFYDHFKIEGNPKVVDKFLKAINF